MKRLLRVAALPTLALLAACGGGEVTVQAALDNPAAGDTVALRELPIRLLPYDRDVLFDSLEQASATPQPEIPQTLVTLQDSIAAAQAQWGQAEERWSVVRDSLRRLSDTLRGMSRAHPQYVVMFRDYNTLEPQEQSARRQMDEAFGRFESLQGRYNAQTEEIRVQRQQWGDEAFASVDSIIDARLEAMDREELVDTTRASGVARFEPKRGRWWVHARWELPYTELYWNVPVEVTGEDQTVRLTRENAQVRPKI